MLTRVQRRQTGVSLVELMIGITIGMVIVAGALAIYLSSLRGGSDTLRSAKLNQALRASMDIMVNDIRRAGFWASATASSTNPFSERGGSTQTDLAIHSVSTTGDCVLFSYDAVYKAGNTAGSVDSDDFFGYRLTGGAVVMRQGNGDGQYTASCTGATGWERFTDTNDVVVDTLSFSTTGSQCVNARTNAVWTSTSATVPPCESSTTGYSATTGDRLIELRQVSITLAGHLTADPVMRISLTQPVRVRNDRVIIAP
ncbi:hypothetical protein EZJ19_09300 [Parasulfuritortus cantonensis]|uniref:Prepilin-type N-terminal cleavage/methylation domain-containing protein n=1 Tax=Parasulfuritortus cantonensis TaxID=2528202 RepID=A0A4R1BCP5_9PROT|nr:prepilin-type N-terminal cleavage/methylation domain-containing protein [Parasulfuritortus cantonensis]TCJ14767.1 hypothetical protein EZJ19_09300 [Parasulfuritortus cantonensis]